MNGWLKTVELNPKYGMTHIKQHRHNNCTMHVVPVIH